MRFSSGNIRTTDRSSETWRKLLSSHTDPLAVALVRKTRTGARGETAGTDVAAGDGWRVRDIVCTSGPADLPFEERHGAVSISLVLSGTFLYRSERGTSLMSTGALVLGSPGHAFECSHQHGEGDRCLSFQFDPALFERVAHDAGARVVKFDRDRLPPLRGLAGPTARARTALVRAGAFEEIALDLAAAAVSVAGGAGDVPAPAARDAARIAPVLRELEARSAEPRTLADLAASAGLSRYHFLRTFRSVTGITPHQWLVRARLRDAAHRLVTTRAPVTEIALDVGFDDLSNFVRSFRAEFGTSPRRYRDRA
jgi:AraC family transcriptional regulator